MVFTSSEDLANGTPSLRLGYGRGFSQPRCGEGAVGPSAGSSQIRGEYTHSLGLWSILSTLSAPQCRFSSSLLSHELIGSLYGRKSSFVFILAFESSLFYIFHKDRWYNNSWERAYEMGTVAVTTQSLLPSSASLPQVFPPLQASLFHRDK